VTRQEGVTVGQMRKKVKSFGGKASCKEEDSRASDSWLLHLIHLQLAASVAAKKVTRNFHLKNVVAHLHK